MNAILEWKEGLKLIYHWVEFFFIKCHKIHSNTSH